MLYTVHFKFSDGNFLSSRFKAINNNDAVQIVKNSLKINGGGSAEILTPNSQVFYVED